MTSLGAGDGRNVIEEEVEVFKEGGRIRALSILGREKKEKKDKKDKKDKVIV